MNSRLSPILAMLALVAAFLLGSLATRPGSAQAPANPAAPVGRYQMAGVPGGVAVIDTATGQTWVAETNVIGVWHDRGSPVPARNTR